MTPSVPIVLKDGEILYDGIVYVPRNSIWKYIADNKKKIMGMVGSFGVGSFMVIQAVPELAATYPLVVKLFCAILTVAGYGGAHWSAPDTQSTPQVQAPPISAAPIKV